MIITLMTAVLAMSQPGTMDEEKRVRPNLRRWPMTEGRKPLEAPEPWWIPEFPVDPVPLMNLYEPRPLELEDIIRENTE